MKRIIFVIVVLLSCVEARFFVGDDGGVSYSMLQKDSDFFGNAKVSDTQYLIGGYIGVNLGSEHYFARDSLLFRWFLSTGGDIGVGYGDLNLGIDFMGTLYKSENSAFGAFIGIEMSTVFMDWVSGFGGAFRVGISAMVEGESRIELYWRKRLGEFSVDCSRYNADHYEYIYEHYRQNDTVMLGYKKLF